MLITAHWTAHWTPSQDSPLESPLDSPLDTLTGNGIKSLDMRLRSDRRRQTVESQDVTFGLR